ncbi:peptidoglycan-binding domain-containing protein [Paracoccus sp. 1_MG-2023]|uniref:peptidoglycan-binding domain-containing protein n=1 Tax=unclassified Paracoccus (in: a-proteobacteria) TaxID=2688777 RepID=UPI001C08C957|nr:MULTISPECIES: peptidoglycan-binding domain-containing protein [unclassified Paracoccus (in: a-proteobacteria)]MBU2958858.1 peptidoglycan-binding protein [Paracoccus sp. C2R09]MDO6670011.1 peptidoglycan-binding domain-containing protein [Paracoccus sp. 1_MG-2023]
MKHALVILLISAGAAQAVPCVGANFDTPLPGAQNVERRSSDVPTARYPGIWQEGRVAGFAYQLASDYSGLLSDSLTAPSWQIAIECGAAGGCTRQTADAPEGAIPVADALERCLTGQPVSAQDFMRPTPAQVAGLPADAGVTDPDRAIDSVAGIATAAGIVQSNDVPAKAAPVAPTKVDRPAAIDENQEAQSDGPIAENLVDLGPSLQPDRECGLQTIIAGTSTVQTLQRLLIAAGEDPGPDDGVMGGRTRKAIEAALGPEGPAMSIEGAIRALNGKMCQE